MVQRVVLSEIETLAISMVETWVAEVGFILGKKSSRKAPIFVIYFQILLPDTDLIFRNSRSNVLIQGSLLVLQSHLIIFLSRSIMVT